jgi:hypothetical protein|tara:strand:- start:474 stop:581 length:108 start_codon:yes stop_codon:yes gene_type:complete
MDTRGDSGAGQRNDTERVGREMEKITEYLKQILKP